MALWYHVHLYSGTFEHALNSASGRRRRGLLVDAASAAVLAREEFAMGIKYMHRQPHTHHSLLPASRRDPPYPTCDRIHPTTRSTSLSLTFFLSCSRVTICFVYYYRPTLVVDMLVHTPQKNSVFLEVPSAPAGDPEAGPPIVHYYSLSFGGQGEK